MAISKRRLIKYLESSISTNEEIARLFKGIDDNMVRISRTKVVNLGFILVHVESGKFDTGIIGIIRRFIHKRKEAKEMAQSQKEMEQDDNE